MREFQILRPRLELMSEVQPLEDLKKYAGGTLWWRNAGIVEKPKAPVWCIAERDKSQPGVSRGFHLRASSYRVPRTAVEPLPRSAYRS